MVVDEVEYGKEWTMGTKEEDEVGKESLELLLALCMVDGPEVEEPAGDEARRCRWSCRGYPIR